MTRPYQPMKIPFETIDWSLLPANTVNGTTGTATSRTVLHDGLRTCLTAGRSVWSSTQPATSPTIGANWDISSSFWKAN